MGNSDNFYDKQQHDEGLEAAEAFDRAVDRHVQRVRTLNEIGAESLRCSAEKGFDNVTPTDWDSPSGRLLIPTKLVLIHTEISEAVEEFRKGHDRQNFGSELADIIIRVGQLGVGLGIDLDAAVAVKQQKNRERPHQHGGRLI